MKLLVLTGASGSGKTTIANSVAARELPSAPVVLHFDSIGVPSPERILREYCSPEAWQEQKTIEWFQTIRDGYADRRAILFEGQMRIAFVRAALALAKIEHAELILVDCDDETRLRRLRVERGQADLATERMITWAAFLREEALTSGTTILETTGRSIPDSVEYVIQRLSLD